MFVPRVCASSVAAGLEVNQWDFSDRKRNLFRAQRCRGGGGPCVPSADPQHLSSCRIKINKPAYRIDVRGCGLWACRLTAGLLPGLVKSFSVLEWSFASRVLSKRSMEIVRLVLKDLPVFPPDSSHTYQANHLEKPDAQKKALGVPSVRVRRSLKHRSCFFFFFFFFKQRQNSLGNPPSSAEK